MADQGTNKTGFVRDDELKRETKERLKGNRSLRPEDPLAPESADEVQPATGGGTPPGMTPQDVAVRNELARHLDRGGFPARRDVLLGSLQRHQAPDTVVDLVRGLPADEGFANVQEIMRALGRGVEDRRV